MVATLIKQHFSLEWPRRSVSRLMVNSQMGDDTVVAATLGGMNAIDMR